MGSSNFNPRGLCFYLSKVNPTIIFYPIKNKYFFCLSHKIHKNNHSKTYHEMNIFRLSYTFPLWKAENPSTLWCPFLHLSRLIENLVYSLHLSFPIPGLSIDFTANKLYWISSANATINRCNLDGSGLEVLENLKKVLAKGTALAVMGECSSSQAYQFSTMDCSEDMKGLNV